MDMDDFGAVDNASDRRQLDCIDRRGTICKANTRIHVNDKVENTLW